MSGEVLSQFGNVFLAGQYSGSGTLKIERAKLSWNAREGSRQETVEKTELVRIEWFHGSRAQQLKCVLKGGLSVRFEGFREKDFDRVDDSIRKSNLLADGAGLIRAKQASNGWNWGKVDVKGGSLNFRSDDKDVLDLTLGDVAQVNLNGSEELALEFHVDDTANPHDECLVEMRFRVKDSEEASRAYEKIRLRSDTSSFAGDSLATFKEVPVIVPRGRYDVDLFQNYFKMHGKSYDFKVLYSSVSRLFLLPKPDEVHIAFVASIDPPIRQGNTHYPHIVFQFKTEQSTSVSINLSDEELQKKYNGKLNKQEEGDSWRVFSKVMKQLSGRSLHTPKTFVSHAEQHAVRTSLGPNEGYLFLLESSFFFVNKPPTYVRFDDVQIVKFKRMDLERRFDLLVQTVQGQKLLFSNIDRPEFKHILKFLNDKNVPHERPEEKPGREVIPMEEEDESEDEDFDPMAKKKAASDDESKDGADSVGDDLEVVEEDDDDSGGEEEEEDSDGGPPKKKQK
ncbi:hypothetical protein NDN08_002997 [Rhodosorus marinus]|uniref:FACT complex subunit SSRP1 n=1 Tax=Rhodosorus marinus TaxID=101924 RepID=A0AAV8UWR7_9RHOD|nr:hypothetical protein NDN08_002997 [Rhodosorus marinus]